MNPKLKGNFRWLEKESIVRQGDLKFLVEKINELQDEIQKLKDEKNEF